MAPVWRAVDGDGGLTSPYPRLVAASAERWARDGSTIEANAAVLGIAARRVRADAPRDPGDGRRSSPTRPAPPGGASSHGTTATWSARRSAGSGRPSRSNGCGRSTTRTSARSARTRTISRSATTSAAPRTGRSSRWRSRPADGRGHGSSRPTREGGLGNLAELIHESGHALHYAAIRTRPAFTEPPTDTPRSSRPIARAARWDVQSPRSRPPPRLARGAAPGGARSIRRRAARCVLGALRDRAAPARRGGVRTTCGPRWSRTASGIEPHPEWSWWAVRGQLIDSPGYLANYVLAAIVPRRRCGPDPRAPRRLVDRRRGLVRVRLGAAAPVRRARVRRRPHRGPAGGPLTVEPVLGDMRRAG